MSSKRSRPARILAFLAIPVLLSGVIIGCASSTLAGLPLTTEQKVEDFRYLADVLLENHPYLWTAQRKTGFDWPAHIDEFEAEVAATKDDKEFALSISRMLRLLNNGHTGLVPGRSVSSYGGFLIGLFMKQWKNEARKTTAERADYWAGLADLKTTSSGFATKPFVALYAAGKYVVVCVSPDLRTGETGIQPGWTIATVDGKPVNEYVAAMLGETALWYDPVRDCVFQRSLSLQPTTGSAAGSVVVTFGTPSGSTASREVPAAMPPWASTYYWPPKYDGAAKDTSTGNMLVALLDEGVGYVQVGSMARDYGSDMKLLRNFITATNPTSLVIDIRGNDGGTDSYWQALVGMLISEEVSSRCAVVWRSGEYVQPFIQQKRADRLEVIPKSELKARSEESVVRIPPEVLTPDFVEPHAWDRTVKPKNSLNFTGKICLLVDDYVFSSAEALAAFCKGSGWATVVGSCTGGDGIGYDPALVTLPNSGMLVRFPLVMGLNPDMSANEEKHTMPDVLAEWSPEDLQRYAETGRPAKPDPSWDPQLRAALEWITGR